MPEYPAHACWAVELTQTNQLFQYLPEGEQGQKSSGMDECGARGTAMQAGNGNERRRTTETAQCAADMRATSSSSTFSHLPRPSSACHLPSPTCRLGKSEKWREDTQPKANWFSRTRTTRSSPKHIFHVLARKSFEFCLALSRGAHFQHSFVDLNSFE